MSSQIDHVKRRKSDVFFLFFVKMKLMWVQLHKSYRAAQRAGANTLSVLLLL